MGKILHITTQEQWEAARNARNYRGDTLDSEGFIHCSLPEQVTKTANRFFRGRTNLMLLVIDEARVRAEVRYEAADADVFPHIYGPLNLDAVDRALPFPSGEDGSFSLPKEITIGQSN